MSIGEDRPVKITLEAPSDKLEEDLKDAKDKLKKFGKDSTSLAEKLARQEERISRKSREDMRAHYEKLEKDIIESKKKIVDYYEKLNDEQQDKDQKASSKRAGALARIGVGFLEKAGSDLFDAAKAGLSETVDFERAMTRFKIGGDVASAGMGTLRTSIFAVSQETGIARTELLSGASAYLALTGDADGAAKSVGLFAMVANASGSTMEDVANTAAAMRDNLKIDPKDFEAGFSALIVQGKAGAIELRNLAQELSGVAPQFSAFAGGSGMKGLVTMGAALQVGRKGFASASEAATGFRALMVALNRNAGKFKGVKIFDKDAKTGKKSLRGFKDIIDGIAGSKLAKDPTLLTKAFGSDEAKRFYDQLVANRSMLDELEAKSSNGGAVKADALEYQQSAAGRLEIAMQKVKMAIAQAFTPERISAFASAVESLASGLNKVVQLIGDIKGFIDNEKAVDEARNAVTRDQVIKSAVIAEKEARPEREKRAKSIAMLERKTAGMTPEARKEVYQRSAALLFQSSSRWDIGTGQVLLQKAGMSPDEANAIGLRERQLAQAGKRSEYARQFPMQNAPGPTGVPSFLKQAPPIILVVDGDVVAKSGENAKSKRRNVGGR